MPCDDLPYAFATCVVIWLACMLWAIVSVWEWRQSIKQDLEYAGLLDSLLGHIDTFDGDGQRADTGKIEGTDRAQ